MAEGRANGRRIGLTFGLGVAFAAAAFAGAGIAVATIPASGTGVITGCYAKTNGALRVIDKQAGKNCTTNEVQLAWNQKGPGNGVLYYATHSITGPVDGQSVVFKAV